MIDKNRLLAVTDGIIAIAATIMVLQLTIPEEVSFIAFAHQWPVLVAYIISYAHIFLAWHEHHDSMANAEVINHRIFLINCLWLFFVTLIPFVTGVIGHAPNHTPSVLLYIAVLLAEQLTITWESVSVVKLNKTVVLDGPVIRKIRIVSIAGYAVAAIVACIYAIAGLIATLIVSIINVVLICEYDRHIAAKVEQMMEERAE